MGLVGILLNVEIQQNCSQKAYTKEHSLTKLSALWKQRMNEYQCGRLGDNEVQLSLTKAII
jgi:hypothetical protein